MRQSAKPSALQRVTGPVLHYEVSSASREYDAGFDIPDHQHDADQLVYAIQGVMQVSSGQSTWFIPPLFALWVPAETRHSVFLSAATSMRTIYLRPDLLADHFRGCSVLHMTPLLRELVLEVVRQGRLSLSDRYQQALIDLTVHHLRQATPVPVFVTLPRDERALNVARRILKSPGQATTLAELARDAGASARTVQRAYQRDLGIDFESWRRQLRITRAVEWLLDGVSVKEVADRVGYCQPSAFVEAFRRTFGSPPGRWAKSLQNHRESAANRPP